MSAPILNDLTLRAVSFALDGLSLRQRVTAQNIANVDTPGYKAQHVSFETQLARALHGESDAQFALAVTDDQHLGGQTASGTEAISVDQRVSDLRNDANNVDIDVEMTTLAETTLRYQALAQLAGSKLSILKSIVRDIR
jgi:flagellar basal-body rod protein FlgB